VDQLVQVHLEEIYPHVHRISVNEGEFFHDGTMKDSADLIDFDAPFLKRFASKLRARRISMDIIRQRVPVGFDPYDVEIEQRMLLEEGFQEDGKWEMQPGDIVMIADQDEIPTAESMRAMLECEPPMFAQARAGGSCNEGKPKLLWKTQVGQAHCIRCIRPAFVVLTGLRVPFRLPDKLHRRG
jgi:hypothetical protein